MSPADLGVFELDDEMKLSRREREERQRIQNILSVALRLLLEKGFVDFSMQSLAEATDYSRAALYKYFPCKEEVVIALAVESFKRRLVLYRMVPDFPGRPRERMVARGEVSFIFFPELFNLEVLTYTNTFRSRTSAKRQQILHEHEMNAFGLGIDTVKEAVECGDLELPTGMTPEEFFFGQSMQMNGILGAASATGPALMEALNVEDLCRVSRRFGSGLMDGFNWRPLSTEWDYRATMKRVYDELFQPVLIDRLTRF